MGVYEPSRRRDMQMAVRRTSGLRIQCKTAPERIRLWENQTIIEMDAGGAEEDESDQADGASDLGCAMNCPAKRKNGDNE
jgi:hypothetical protein